MPTLKTTLDQWRWLFREVLIIVLGVLIAFAVNDYWSDRQDRVLELQYIKRLQEDLQSDTKFVERIDVVIKRKLEALNAIAPVVRGEAEVPDDLETFFRYVTQAGIAGAYPTYVVTRTTYDDLKATGHFRLIRDAEFRSTISQYYVTYENQYQRLLVRRTGYFKYVHAFLPAELREDFSMIGVQEFGLQRALDKVTSEEFQDLLNQEYNYAYFLRIYQLAFAEESNRLIRAVKEHIQELES